MFANFGTSLIGLKPVSFHRQWLGVLRLHCEFYMKTHFVLFTKLYFTNCVKIILLFVKHYLVLSMTYPNNSMYQTP